MDKKLLIIGLVAVVALAVVGCAAKQQPAAEEPEETTETEEKNEVLAGKDEETGIRYISFGHGPKTMVIVPGLSTAYVTDNAQAVAGSFAAFADDYTIYLFDVREEVPEGYTVNDMSDDMVKVINKLGLEHLYLYGCSMGGMETMYVAGTYPQLVEKAVVVSTSCEANETLTAVIGKWVNLAKEGKLTEMTSDMGQKIYSASVYEANKEAFVAMADGLKGNMLSRFINSGTAVLNMDMADTAAKIECPLLIIGAKGDQVVSGAASERIAEITGGELITYSEEYPHAIYDEVPEVKEKAKAFFDAE